MNAQDKKDLTDFAVANWGFPADVAEKLKSLIDEKEAEASMCDMCGGVGIVTIPSMLGFGDEDYPCLQCNKLSPEESDRVLAETRAIIDRRIR